MNCAAGRTRSLSTGKCSCKKEISEGTGASDPKKRCGDLYELAHKKKRLTLLFASKNESQNNATVLKELLDGTRKLSTGTGPGAVYAMRKRAAVPRR